jgi:AcrR family transcriptional regulator
MPPLIRTTSSVKALIYNSPTINDRRRRILHETRAMIAERGYEQFSIRELTKRAGVAQRTLYNAFGSRENIVVTAIHQYSRDFTDTAQYAYPAHTMFGQLERIIKASSRSLQLRPYIVAVMAIYNSHSADGSIRQVMRKLSNEGFQPFTEHLVATNQLLDHAAPEELAEHLTRFMYATQTAWCKGDIPDDSMIESLAETFLLVTLAFTRRSMIDPEQWLDYVRARAPEWLKLRDKSVVPDSGRRISRRRGQIG